MKKIQVEITFWIIYFINIVFVLICAWIDNLRGAIIFPILMLLAITAHFWARSDYRNIVTSNTKSGEK